MPGNHGKMNDEMFRLARRMNQIMDDWMHAPFRGDTTEAWQPAVDVIECEYGVCIIAELAGMTDSNIRVVVEREKIVISGERRLKEISRQKEVQQMELARGPFRRAIALPFTPHADKLRIRCEDGLLEILVDKPGDREK